MRWRSREKEENKLTLTVHRTSTRIYNVELTTYPVKKNEVFTINCFLIVCTDRLSGVIAIWYLLAFRTLDGLHTLVTLCTLVDLRTLQVIVGSLEKLSTQYTKEVMFLTYHTRNRLLDLLLTLCTLVDLRILQVIVGSLEKLSTQYAKEVMFLTYHTRNRLLGLLLTHTAVICAIGNLLSFFGVLERDSQLNRT
jgi:hypothetical protein